MKKSYALVLGLMWVGIIHAQIVINEIMQSNIDCIMDDWNDFPDSWVELYNCGDSAVPLNNYALGLAENYSSAYVFKTNEYIRPHSYFIIYCDKGGLWMHTDFRLESGKGEIFLFDNSGKIIDQVKHAKMPAPNVAYGRKIDGNPDWGYMVVPTPGAPNNNVSEVILPSPGFSVPGGIFTSPFELSIILPEINGLPDNTNIYYTIDGSEPTENSLLVTNEPLLIDRTTIIRAKILAPGVVSIPSVTQSYIFHPREVTIPVVSIVTDNRYFYDDKIGIYEGEKDDPNANYKQDWRRPINIEYFPEEGKVGFNQLSETRLHGGSSRDNQQKSLAIYANKRFGTKRFECDIWNTKPGIGERGLIKSFVLRSGGNDFPFAHIRDAFVQTLFGRMTDLDWQAYQPAITYINGVYKGIYNIRERSNEDYVFANYEGLEDIDMLENWDQVKAGDDINFKMFEEIYNSSEVTYEVYDKLMDIEEFMNMMILETYASNFDFPSNNSILWRPREDSGKWRWIIKDLDYASGIYGDSSEYSYLNFLLHEKPSDEAFNKAIKLFQSLVGISEYKEQFIDRFSVYLGDFLVPQYTVALLDSLSNNISGEYPFHQEVYGLTQDWNNEIEKLKKWYTERTPYIYRHLQEYFNLGKIIPVTIQCNDVNVIFNKVPLTQSAFTGSYYAGRTISLKASAIADPFIVKGWEVNYRTETDQVLHSMLFDTSSIDFQLIPSYTEVSFRVLTDLSGINTYYQGAKQVKVSVKDKVLYVEKLPEGSFLNILDCTGRTLYQHKTTHEEWSVKLPASGVYILSVTDDKKRSEVRKIVVR